MVMFHSYVSLPDGNLTYEYNTEPIDITNHSLTASLAMWWRHLPDQGRCWMIDVECRGACPQNLVEEWLTSRFSIFCIFCILSRLLMVARYLLNFIDAALKNVLGRVPGAQLISLARISRFTGDSVESMGHSKLVRHDSLLVGGDWNMTFMTCHILGIIIPTDFHIFQPPTSIGIGIVVVVCSGSVQSRKVGSGVDV